MGILAPETVHDFSVPEIENISPDSPQHTENYPLQLQFLKGEIHLSSNNLETMQVWARQVRENKVPIFIYSYASTPTGIRNMTKAAARHEAVRVAFNRGLIAKSYLVQCGINENRLILSATNSAPSKIDDSITITTLSNHSESQ